MTTPRNELLAVYVRDMLAVENEMHSAFRRQKHDDRLNIHPESAQLVGRIEDTIDRHLVALRQALARLGGKESTLKMALGSVMGAAAGIYDGMRSDDPLSRNLRDDYIALSTAIVCYEMLHTTALASGDQHVADLAIAHLRDFAPLTVALTNAIPHAIIEELSRDGEVPPAHDAADQAVANTREAWMEGAAVQ
jgi:ferritin-like metal-binding protein YciE